MGKFNNQAKKYLELSISCKSNVPRSGMSSNFKSIFI